MSLSVGSRHSGSGQGLAVARPLSHVYFPTHTMKPVFYPLLTAAAVLAGSSPVVTVLITSRFDDDTVSPTQLLGVAGTIAGATMIAIGS